MSARPEVTIVVPTRNAGSDFREVVRRIQLQRLDSSFEMLIIDSGSVDDTLDIARTLLPRARVIEIPPATFNHGLTRDLGVREARGDLVVMIVQDALPFDDQWLHGLVSCFADRKVAGAYSRQLPRPNASPFIRQRLQAWMPDDVRKVQAIEDTTAFSRLPPADKLKTVVFDNVSSCVRRSVALEIPFRARRFGEDLDWSYRALLAGYQIVYEPRSRVLHSHDYSGWYEFKRANLDHQNREQLLGTNAPENLAQLARRTVADAKYYVKAAVSDPKLGTAARIGWSAAALPFSATQSLGQYLGARSVDRLERGSRSFRLIDRLLSRGV